MEAEVEQRPGWFVRGLSQTQGWGSLLLWLQNCWDCKSNDESETSQKMSLCEVQVELCRVSHHVQYFVLGDSFSSAGRCCDGSRFALRSGAGGSGWWVVPNSWWGKAGSVQHPGSRSYVVR